jgi:hypothetical protein
MLAFSEKSRFRIWKLPWAHAGATKPALRLSTHTAMLARHRAHNEETLPTQDFAAEC